MGSCRWFHEVRGARSDSFASEGGAELFLAMLYVMMLIRTMMLIIARLDVEG